MSTPDLFGRPLGKLRVSVTDRCNLRCAYCMPEEEYQWLPRKDLLHFGETATIVDSFIALGAREVRLTGGEPLVRRELERLVAMLAERPRLQDIALTTNGILLAAQAATLRRAGLRRLTISLDTLREDRFFALTRRTGLGDVLAGIRAAREAGFAGTKLNTVVIRGFNDDELAELIELGRREAAEVRFIEYMDVGGATRWKPEQVVSREEILGRLSARYGAIEDLEHAPHAPAERFRLADGTSFGVIASTTRPFCLDCDRARLTADGVLYLCLYARAGINLRDALRQGAGPEQLEALIRTAWSGRKDRGAEERLGLPGREPLARPAELRGNLHLEMHTRGG